MLKMKILFQKMLLISCLLSVTALFGETKRFDDEKIFKLMGESKTNIKNLCSVKKEEKKNQQPSIKKIMGAVGVVSFCTSLLSNRYLPEDLAPDSVLFSILVGTTSGVRHLAGKSSKKRSAFEGLCAMVGGIGLLKVSPEKQLRSLSQELNLNDSTVACLIISCGAGITTGLVEGGIRKWEEYRRKKD